MRTLHFSLDAVEWQAMAQNDSHHAVLIANLILDQAMSISNGCEKLSQLLHRLGVDHEPPYLAITRVRANFREPRIPTVPQYRSTANLWTMLRWLN